MDDLEICKKIAEIEKINYTTCVNVKVCPARNAIYFREYEGNRPAPMYTKALREYNPLTDDALCFRLMVKYKVELDFWSSEAEIYFCPEYDERIPVTVDCKDMKKPNKAICLCIIEAHNES